MAVHTGHRQRVKEKLIKNGVEAFADHELLELLLFYAIPYRDTNPIAHALLSKCRSLYNLLQIPASVVASVDGCGERTAEFLMLFSELGRRAFVTMGHEAQYRSTEAVRALALRTIEHTDAECTYLLLFDNCFTLLDTRLILEGYLASAAMTPSLIVEPALALHASAAVLVTRHKNRIARPDRYEYETIRHTKDVLDKIGIHLLEAYMVGGNLIVPMLKNHKSAFPISVASDATLSDGEDRYEYRSVIPEAAPYAAGFSDEELLTLIFTYLMPLDGGKTIHHLLTAYGTMQALLSADEEELLSRGATPHALSFLRFFLPAYGRFLRAQYPAEHSFTSEDDIGVYLTACCAGCSNENAYLLLLREDKTVIDCRRMAIGSANSASLNTRALLETAMFSGARHVALAHNHPNGSTTPSDADINTTHLLQEAFKTIRVELIEHFTIAGNLYTPILEEERRLAKKENQAL